MPTKKPETPDRVLSLLGMVASGDLGNLTCYRSKTGRIVSFAKTWPAKPASLAQLTGRARMSFAAQQWRTFTPANKLAWKQCARRAHLVMTGYNLWVRWFLTTPWSDFSTLMLQTDVDVLNHINRTSPTLPLRSTLEPLAPIDQYSKGRVRFGRKFVITPPNTIEPLPFAAEHHLYPTLQNLERYFGIYGPGSLAEPAVLNNRWCAAAFTSASSPGYTVVELLVIWPDGSSDTTKTIISVHNFPYPG